MISTVTASTVSTIAISTLAGPVALIGILVLLVLLVQKELASAASGRSFQTLVRALDIGIVPLLIAFGLAVISRVVEILR